MFGFGKGSKDPGKDYAEGSKLFDKGDYKGAIKAFRKSAESGNAEAQYALGNMYHDGKGTLANPSVAPVRCTPSDPCT